MTPIYIADQWGDGIDWNQFMRIWEKLPKDQQHVGKLIGVTDQFIIDATMGLVSRKNPKHVRFEF